MESRLTNTLQTDAASTLDARQRPLPGIVAAIPCYNEELYVGSVVLKAKEFSDRVVVVDDGSLDKTALVAARAGAQVIQHDANKGKAAAVRTAFGYARKTGCSVLVLLDGDGQHEPAYIPSLVKPVLDGQADIVVGSRFLDIKSPVPGYRVLGQRILTLLTNLGSRMKLTDSQSGLRAFSPRAIEALSFVEEGLSVESEMQFVASEAGLKMTEVAVGIGYHEKVKRNPLGHGIGVLNSIIGLISRRIPIFFFGIPGIALLGIGLWQGWKVVNGYNTYGEFWLGPALLAVMLGIIGVLSLFTGLILHTIKSYLK